MKIVVIGAGICGLASGYFLSTKNHQVVILEKEKSAGGLSRGFKQKKWLWSLEDYPHHLFTSDTEAKNLIRKLNLESKLFFGQPKTSIFAKGRIFQFDSPLSILSAPFLNLPQKIRTGLTTTYLKLTSSFKTLEKCTAKEYLSNLYGKKAAEFLWQPLLLGKFGKDANSISMSWFWGRIKKRSRRLGYLEGGFQTLVDRLTQEIKKNHGQIICNQEVKNLNELRKDFDKIIVTVPSSIFLKIAPDLPFDYQKKLQSLKMIGSLDLIMVLKEKFLTDDTYWLNINEPGFPFVFIDEQTNFVNSTYYNNKHLLYVGGYYPQNHRYFKNSKEQIFKEFLPYLGRINPNFNFSLNVSDYVLKRDLFSQPIVPVNYSQMILPFKTPFENIYLANMQQIYPWDRGINYAIESGKKIADFLVRDEN